MDAATPNQLLGWWIQITWCFPAFIVPSVLATSQTMTEPPPVQSLNLKIVKYKTRLTLSEKAVTVQEKVLKDFLKKKTTLRIIAQDYFMKFLACILVNKILRNEG